MSSDHVPIALRRVVAARARDYCEYCQTPADFSTQSFTVEHIRPRVQGGSTTLDNLAWACFGCNSYKHTQTQALDSESNEIVALYNPRTQSWNEHFAWSEDHLMVTGKTACGRATILALNLNRSGLVNLRRILKLAGLHPPKHISTSE